MKEHYNIIIYSDIKKEKIKKILSEKNLLHLIDEVYTEKDLFDRNLIENRHLFDPKKMILIDASHS